MKTSTITAAIRCAAAGRIAVREGKSDMGRLARKSHLSLLHASNRCGIDAGHRFSFTSHQPTIPDVMESRIGERSVESMQPQSYWQQDGDTRLAGNRMRLNVMPSQKTPTLKALALA